MSDEWITTLKPTFQTEWLKLPPKESRQILEKLELLRQDPTPDAKVKKRLRYLGGKVCRLRSGNYRIIYTFEKPNISLLALRFRDDDTYDEDFDPELLKGFDPSLASWAPPPQPDWEKLLARKEPKKTPLAARITRTLLASLHVPEEHHAALLALRTRDDLLACPGVPDELLVRIDDALHERPLQEVATQPDFIAGDIQDLLRFKEGDLRGFLLRLDPQQEKLVEWGMKASGPTLLKGGPGSGKSTVALYRTRASLARLKATGGRPPRILFTTYTNALVAFSRQLLETLLGDEAGAVEVRTADHLAMAIASRAGKANQLAEHAEQKRLVAEVMASVKLSASRSSALTQKRALERLGAEYVLEEIESVIVARGLDAEGYLAAARPGRRLALNATQRAGIHRVAEAFAARLDERGLTTWSRLRLAADTAVADGQGPEAYDAVIVDEAQDLDPVLLRMLVRLATEPNRVFLTADANQSIYRSGFSWADVHESLRFRGRTGQLRANYRSTREIAEAARAYLGGDVEDAEGSEQTYVNAGPMPVLRTLASEAEEVRLVARFLRAAARELRLGIGSSAVLVPTERVGKRLAQALCEAAVPATFMSGRELDLRRPGVKVVTLKSAKGLEFPIVALAGFTQEHYPFLRAEATDEDRREVFARERRALYVGMTRAMRGLLVVVPGARPSPLFAGFEGALWNLGGE